MVYLSMAFHQHQPVGNFDHVIEESYKQAYLPFVQVLTLHPEIKLTMHYSGPLLKWLERSHPEFFELLKSLVDREQIEFMAGGFYEPILPILPRRDKFDQINKMIKYIKTHFGYKTRGLWLAERVWEPHLAAAIRLCGLDYVILDDSHLKEAGIEDNRLYGYYLTEEEGYTLAVFPSIKKLRYTMPFAPPEETIEYLRNIAGMGDDLLVQVGDDGEKFGSWPHTYHTVYEEGWLDRFFSLREENRSWLCTIPHSTYMDRHKPLGGVYLPTASYAEMMEWALPTKKRLTLEAALKRVGDDPQLDFCLPFLKGGFWRNFLVKYPESNNMHKKMLYISQKLSRLEKLAVNPDKYESAKDELQQGQCNCAYWHGVFGGLYLPHLRHAIYEHLIKAECIVDALRYPKNTNRLEFDETDLLKNGTTSLMVNTNQYNLYLNLEQGGSIYEFDYKPAKINLLNNFTRQYEAYHEDIKQQVGHNQNLDDNQGPQSIHNIQNLKEEGLEHYLSYDWYQRNSLLDHFLAADTTIKSFKECSYGELGDFVNQPYNYTKRKTIKQFNINLYRAGQVDGRSLSVEKQLKLNPVTSAIGIKYKLQNLSLDTQDLWFGVEFNINPLHQWGTFFQAGDTKKGIDDNLVLEGKNRLALIIKDLGIRVDFTMQQASDIWCFPIYTVSQAESGYERGYQGSSILIHWRIRLEGQESWQVQMQKEVKSI